MSVMRAECRVRMSMIALFCLGTAISLEAQEVPAPPVVPNNSAVIVQDLENNLALLELRLQDLATNRRRLNAIANNQTAFAAGVDLAALANPTQYQEFQQLMAQLDRLSATRAGAFSPFLS